MYHTCANDIISQDKLQIVGSTKDGFGQSMSRLMYLPNQFKVQTTGIPICQPYFVKPV